MHRRIRTSAASGAILATAFLLGCLTADHARADDHQVSGTPSGAISVQPTTYNGWSSAYRLTNGTVDLVVVPDIGRIMRYGYVGGPNLLWNNPGVAGTLAVPGTWPNFGGDKAWPWPQYDWPSVIGHNWPPPPAADGRAFAARVLPGGALQLVSDPLDQFNLRIERTIRLQRTGTGVTIVTQLVKIAGPGSLHPIGAWTITQVPAPLNAYAHLVTTAGAAPTWKPLGFDPFAAVTASDGVLQITRNPAHSSKVGIDADAVGVLVGDTLFVLRESAPNERAYTSGERTQVYTEADPTGPGAAAPPYSEMELTSPRIPLNHPGDAATLTTTWSLTRIAPGADPEAAFRVATMTEHAH